MTETQREFTTGTDHSGRPARSLRPALEVLDIGAEGVGLLAEPEWSEGDRNARTLLKTESLRLVLTALRAGATMQNEDPDESISVHGLQGTMDVEVDGATVAVHKGELVCLAGGDPWSLTASSDCLFLLTVGRARPATHAAAE
jgi:quercetin dioxygenase-like cupin family protein